MNKTRVLDLSQKSALDELFSLNDSIRSPPEHLEPALQFAKQELGPEWTTAYLPSLKIKLDVGASSGFQHYVDALDVEDALDLAIGLSKFKEISSPRLGEAIRRLKIKSSERISTAMEVICASRYLSAGYPVELLLENDFKFKYLGEWLHVECKRTDLISSDAYRRYIHFIRTFGLLLREIARRLPDKITVELVTVAPNSTLAKKVAVELNKLLELQEPTHAYFRVSADWHSVIPCEPTKSSPLMSFDHSGLKIFCNPFGNEFKRAKKEFLLARRQLTGKKGIVIIQVDLPETVKKMEGFIVKNWRNYRNVAGILVYRGHRPRDTVFSATPRSLRDLLIVGSGVPAESFAEKILSDQNGS